MTSILFGLLLLLPAPPVLLLQQTLTGSVIINVQASDPSPDGVTPTGVARVECLIDAINLLTLTTPTNPPMTYLCPWNTTLVVNGSHIITARATDGAGNIAVTTLTVIVNNSAGPPPDTTPPVITIISPIANSTLTGKINVSASALDNVNTTQMQLFIRGALRATASGLSLNYNWNTAPDKKFSPLTLTTTAIDAAGNLSSKTIQVSIH